MASVIDKLCSRNLISPPISVKNRTHYEVVMGSVAYGCNENNSDYDVYGFSIPQKDMVFPHISGHINGFGRKPPSFEQYQEQHILDKQENREYDLQIYNIVKYFQLCMENNPNMIDSLFVARRCVLHTTKIGEIVRENRNKFLHKGCWHKFRGYAFSQMSKCKDKNSKKFVEFCDKHDIGYYDPLEGIIIKLEKNGKSSVVNEAKSLVGLIEKNGNRSKRIDLIASHGYDTKFAYHIVRLLLECEQILLLGTIDLERDREVYKSIRRGEWTLEMIEKFFQEKELHLERLYNTSPLQHSPNEDELKQILLNCLEEYYGNISECITNSNGLITSLKEINRITENVLRQVK